MLSGKHFLLSLLVYMLVTSVIFSNLGYAQNISVGDDFDALIKNPDKLKKKLAPELRRKLIKYLLELPPVKLDDTGAQWMDEMRVTGAVDVSPLGFSEDTVEFLADAILEVYITGHNAIITAIDGGTQFTYMGSGNLPRIQPLFAPNPDRIKKITELAHKLGIRVIMHTTTSYVGRGILEIHPEWSQISLVNGEPTQTKAKPPHPYRACAFLCFNNLQWCKEMFSNIKQVVDGAKLDGLMPDEILWTPDEESCGCKYCQEKFKKEFGQSIPAFGSSDWLNWRTEKWRKWVNARNQWTGDFIARMVKDVLAGDKNKAFLTCNTGIVRHWRWQTGHNITDFARKGTNIMFCEAEGIPVVARKRYLYPYFWPRYFCKLKNYRSFVNNDIARSVLVMFYPTTRISDDSEQFFCWAFAKTLGANYWSRRTSVPSNSVSWEKAHEELFEKSHDFADIAVVFNSPNLFLYRSEKFIKLYCDEFNSWCELFAENRIPYCVLMDDDFQYDSLKKYKLIILPNTALMSDAQSNAIREYVLNGGNLIATFETSLFENDGRQRKNYGLSDILKINRPESTSLDTNREYSALIETLKKTPQEFMEKAIEHRVGKGRVLYFAYPAALCARESNWEKPMVERYQEAFDSKRKKMILDSTYRMHGDQWLWKTENLPENVIANALIRDNAEILFHFLNASGMKKKPGDMLPKKVKMIYPLLKYSTNGDDIIIKVSKKIKKAKLHSPDLPNPIELPVVKNNEGSIISISPDLIHRYSVVQAKIE